MTKTLAAMLVATLAGQAAAQFSFTLFHNNDGESALWSRNTAGGIDRFVSVLARERAALNGGASITISTGDNFLAGRQLAASQQNLANDPTNGTFYDAQALEAIGYDAVIVGNHEFDFGPGLFEQLVRKSNDEGRQTTFLSANLDFSANAGLAAQQAAGNLAKSKILNVAGNQVAIVAATTPFLRRISSPGDVGVDLDVRNAVQTEIDRLQGLGINNIIFASHLQSVGEDRALIGQLRGVDFAIAGGGDDLLANPGTPLLPGDNAVGPYPLAVTDADGRTVNVVTTSGAYRYLGKVNLSFDGTGNLTGFDAADIGPERVIDASTGAADGVTGDAAVRAAIVDPIAAFSAQLDANVIARVGTNVKLDGRRAVIRTRESGMGNLVADSILWQAEQELGTSDNALIGFQNGGGIRNDVVLNGGANFTEGNTFDIVPFSNFVSIIRDVTMQQLLVALENSVSRIANGDGRFLQVSGFRFTYDISLQGSLYDNAGNLITLGNRIQDVYLEDGTALILDGVILDDALLVDIATIDFLANGGDFYDFRSNTLDRGATSYQEALEAFVIDGLNGRIDGVAYRDTGEGRIRSIPTPAAAGLLGLAALAAGRRRR